MEQLFQRYGHIVAISMHKGYAFVQYMSEIEARCAVAGEDQRLYANQPIDVHLASEPKPDRPSRKRPHGAGAEWDFYYDVPVFSGRVPPLHQPIKRTCPEGAYLLNVGPRVSFRAPYLAQVKKQNRSNNHKSLSAKRWQQGSKYATEHSHDNLEPSADILICGNCKQTFTDVKTLSTHKNRGCRLRFACRCQHQSPASNNSGDSSHPASLTCVMCHEKFRDSWDLCRHCQSWHGLQIYVDVTDDDHSVTSDSVSSEGTSETQGSASNSDVTETLTVTNRTENGYHQTSGETAGVMDELVTAESEDLPEEVNDTSCELEGLMVKDPAK